MRTKNRAVHTIRYLLLLASIGSFTTAMANKQTPANDDGSGNVLFLDRHNPDCGLNGIEAIQLIRPTGSQIAFNYQCQWSGDSSRTDRFTHVTEDGGGNARILDRHAVDCGGKTLQYLHLHRPSSNQIAYHYRCGDSVLTNITDHFTPSTDDGGGNSLYLDRHAIRCPSGDVLTYMHLFRPTASTIAYYYKCGKTSPKQTPPNEDGGGNVRFLDRHNPDCGLNGIGSLRLVRPTGNQIAFNYQCRWTGDLTRTDRFTPANEDGGGNMLYLDRHGVDCGGKALQYLHLHRPNASQIAYHYRCGEKALTDVTEYYTPGNEDGGGNALFLDRHELRCPAADVLTYMRLFRPSATTIAYHYKCGKYMTGKPSAYALVQSAYERSAPTLYGADRQDLDALKARLNAQIDIASGLTPEQFLQLGQNLADQIEQFYATAMAPGPRLICPANMNNSL